MQTSDLNFRSFIESYLESFKNTNTNWIKEFKENPMLALFSVEVIMLENAQIEQFKEIIWELNNNRSVEQIIERLREEVIQSSRQNLNSSRLNLARNQAKVKILDLINSRY